jgi:hypothetical protein
MIRYVLGELYWTQRQLKAGMAWHFLILAGTKGSVACLMG